MKFNPCFMRPCAGMLAAIILLSSCASTTLIRTEPGEAKLFLNGEYVGRTPYTYRDTKIVGSRTQVRIEKDGYEPFSATFSRDEEADAGAIVGGIFVLFPFLWTMKYKPERNYLLVPLKNNNVQQTPAPSGK